VAPAALLLDVAEVGAGAVRLVAMPRRRLWFDWSST
jgi:hypothetical protein